MDALVQQRSVFTVDLAIQAPTIGTGLYAILISQGTIHTRTVNTNLARQVGSTFV